jgi:membrane associated rhomboid family serine protease
MLERTPTVVKNIIIINVLFYLATMALPQLEPLLAGHYFESPEFRPWQIITHMFMHSQQYFTHILFNMYGVYMFGSMLERYWGPKRFLTYYMICGIGAFFLHMGINYWEVSQLKAAMSAEQLASVYELGYSALLEGKNFSDPTMAKLNLSIFATVVGASGALFGILVAFGMMFPNTELMLLIPPMPIKAKYFVIGYGAIELFLAFRNSPTDNVAHFAHIGGMIFGFILIKYWQRKGQLY